MAVAYGSPAAIEAVREFLEDGAHGGTNTPATTYNETLALVRTALSLSAGTGTDGTQVPLPDIVGFDDWFAVGAYAQEYPRVGIVWAGHDGESEALNQQRFDHRIELVVTVAAADLEPIAGHTFGEGAAAMRALGLYDQAFTTMFLRRGSDRDAYGKDLNNGGTGRAQGRIVLARYNGVRDVVAFGEEHAPLLAMTSELIVRIVEDT
jgi:hypothetical protein